MVQPVQGVENGRFPGVWCGLAGREAADCSGTLAVTNSFGYNLRSELVAASMGENSYNYAYDQIGNRQSASKNSDSTSYTANALNQYSVVSRIFRTFLFA